MPERPLTAGLDSTFAALDDLVRRDADAWAHAEAQERLAYLLESVQSMQTALRRLRAATLLAEALDPSDDLVDLWPRTRAEIRARAPAGFRTPGHAIVAGHLDLLRLVEYTAASAATAHDRCRHILEQLTRRLTGAPTGRARHVGGDQPAQPAIDMRAALAEAVERIVSEVSRVDVAAICGALGIEARR